MTPEVADYLLKARHSLAEAAYLMAGGWTQGAARAAYYAGYQAALAYIFGRSGQTPKTHSSTRSEFARLGRHDPAFDDDDRRFLGKAYQLKTAADYGTGEAADVSEAEATQTLATAGHLIQAVETALGNAPAAGAQNGDPA